MTDWKAFDKQLIARAWEDDEFRAALLNDPQAAVAQAGLELPEGVALEVVEETPDVHVLVLPPNPNVDEMDDVALSEEDLEMVAGGGGRTGSTCRQRTCPGYPRARQMSCHRCSR